GTSVRMARARARRQPPLSSRGARAGSEGDAPLSKSLGGLCRCVSRGDERRASEAPGRDGGCSRFFRLLPQTAGAQAALTPRLDAAHAAARCAGFAARATTTARLASADETAVPVEADLVPVDEGGRAGAVGVVVRLVVGGGVDGEFGKEAEEAELPVRERARR